MNNNENNLFDKFFSIDEFRLSALVILMFVFAVATLVSFFLGGVVPMEFIDLIKSLIYAIAGINVVSGITNMISNSKPNSNPIDYSNRNESPKVDSTKPKI